VLQAIAQSGYGGYIGLEYFSTGDPSEGLGQALDLFEAAG
jgi:hydroxypyruvate isomerase